MPKQLSLGKGWIPWPLQIRIFVASHRNILPTIGALIVFGTFIVKDNFRDHYHDISSNLASAQSMLAIRRDTSISKALLMTVAQKTDITLDYLNRIAKHEKLPPTESYEQRKGMEIWAQVGLAAFENNQDEEFMAALDMVCKDMPSKNENCKRLAALKNELKVAMEAGSAEYMFEKNDWPSGREAEEEALRKKFAQLNELRGNSAEPFSHRLQQLSEEITRQAEDVRSNAELAYRRLARLSIVLYSLGWGLGLVSKLSGLRAGSEE